MALFDDIANEEVISPISSAATTQGAWIDMQGAHAYRIICTVDNLSGTTPTLDWSIEQKDQPWDAEEAVTELFAAAAFTQVTGGPFPNEQIKFVGMGDRSLLGKKYIRPVWTLGGTTPVATVRVRVEKI